MIRARPGSLLMHPIGLMAMAITWCNDHYWKQLYPGWLTGKLSDAAGLVFFPLWVASSVELALLLFKRQWLARVPFMLSVVCVTAALFAAIKVHPGASHAYEQLMLCVRLTSPLPNHPNARVINHVDPSDLLALPALAVPLWLVTQRIGAVQP